MNRSVIQRLVKRSRPSQYPPAVVLGSSVNGLSYVRSLARRGIAVLCVDHYQGVASRSRLGCFLLLDRRRDEAIAGEHAADQLFEQLHAQGVTPVVLGSCDEWQMYIADRVASGLAPFHSLAPGKVTVEQIVDKQAQYECASKLGIAVPAFANARSVMEGDVAWSIYPAIIKPRWAHAGRDVIGGKAMFAQSEMVLRERLSWLDQTANLEDYIVQKVIDGDDDSLFAYLGCFDQYGTEISYAIKRKLRQYPRGFGDGSYDATCEDVGLVQPSRQLLAALQYRGLVGIEFKRDHSSGELAMIEVNPRTVSTNQLAITAGVDFPWHAYQLALGTPAVQVAGVDPAGYRTGVHHVHEEREFRSFLQRRRSGETGVVEWLRCMFGADSYAIWDKADPWPFVWTVLSGLRRRFARRFERPTAPQPIATAVPPLTEATVRDAASSVEKLL